MAPGRFVSSMPNAMVSSSSGSNLCLMARYSRKKATQIMTRLPHPMLARRPAMPVDSTKVSRLSNTKLELEVNALHIRLLDYD